MDNNARSDEPSGTTKPTLVEHKSPLKNFAGKLNKPIAVIGALLVVFLVFLVIRFSHTENKQAISTREPISPGSSPAANWAQNVDTSSWNTYTNDKYHYSFSFPHQPADAQKLVIVSEDNNDVDLFSSCCMVVLKAGTQQPETRYFSLQVNHEDNFDKFASLSAAIIQRLNQEATTKYNKGLLSKKEYQQYLNSTPQKITFQNYPAFTYESEAGKLLFVNVKDKTFRIFIGKEDPLGAEIFSTVKLNK